MKKKIFAMVLSLSVSVSALGITAFASIKESGCDHHNSCSVDSESISYDYVNPTQHCVNVFEEHFCYGCQDYHIFSYSYHEGHSYSLNMSTGMLECSECGDSYQW